MMTSNSALAPPPLSNLSSSGNAIAVLMSVDWIRSPCDSSRLASTFGSVTGPEAVASTAGAAVDEAAGEGRGAFARRGLVFRFDLAGRFLAIDYLDARPTGRRALGIIAVAPGDGATPRHCRRRLR